MTKVIINRWDGGLAQDVRTHNTNESEDSRNFDLTLNYHSIITLPAHIEEEVNSQNWTRWKVTDVVKVGTGYVALGRKESSNPYPKFFKKSTVLGQWEQSTEETTGTPVAGTLIAYKGNAYALRTDASGHVLMKYDGASITSIGTITDSGTATHLFVHPEDNILYGVIGITIFKYDGTTFSEHDSILSSELTYSSLTNMGSYLAIAGYTPSGNSTTYLWGRDTTLNTLQSTINFGNGFLGVIANIDGNLVGVMAIINAQYRKIVTKIWSGGEVTEVSDIAGNYTTIPFSKSINQNKLYFIASTQSVMCVFKNKNGDWIISNAHNIDNSTTTPPDAVSSVLGCQVVDDFVFLSYPTVSGFTLTRSKFDDFSSLSSYKTTINPNMYIEDRYEDKQLDGIYIAYTGASAGTTVVKYSVDGSSMTTAISESNSTGEKIKYTTTESDGKPFLSGREFQFQIESTGGAKIKELGYYYTKIKHSN